MPLVSKRRLLHFVALYRGRNFTPNENIVCRFPVDNRFVFMNIGRDVSANEKEERMLAELQEEEEEEEEREEEDDLDTQKHVVFIFKMVSIFT
jgi:hypothetical protein